MIAALVAFFNWRGCFPKLSAIRLIFLNFGFPILITGGHTTCTMQLLHLDTNKNMVEAISRSKDRPSDPRNREVGSSRTVA